MDTSSVLSGQSIFSCLNRDGTIPIIDGVLRSIKKACDENDWRTIVFISQKLYGNMGVPKGAVDLKAMLTVGESWLPVYTGPNVAWGAKAYTWLVESYYPMYNVRGQLYNFQTDVQLDSIAIDRDGDFAYLLTASDSGFPMVQAIPNRLIKNPPGIRTGYGMTITLKVPKFLASDLTDAEKTQGGAVTRTLTASYVCHGIAYNAFGHPFAYCVYEDASEERPWDPSSRYKWVHEQYLIHTFDPAWYEQGRGFPAFTHAVREFVASLTSQGFEEITHMIMSSIALEEHNETGMSDQSDPTQSIGTKTLADNQAALANGEVPEIVMEQIIGGVVKYFRSNTGAKITTPARTSPGPVWDAFQDRLIRIALTGVNMPPSIVWKADGQTGTSNRVDIEKVQYSVKDRQGLLKDTSKRKLLYGLAVAMNTGRLEKVADWYQWDFSMPPEFIIDDGRYAKSDREDYTLGVQTMGGILRRRGQNFRSHIKERAEEEALKQVEVYEVNERYKAHPAKVLVTLDMLGKPAGPGAVTPPGDPSTQQDGPPDAKTGPAKA